MIKKIHFDPVFGAEFKNGDILPFPEGYRDHRVKAAVVDNKLVLTHPLLPPMVLKGQRWQGIHPSLKTTKTNCFIPRKNKPYEIYGDMNGPFATIAWFALGRNPNGRGIRR